MASGDNNNVVVGGGGLVFGEESKQLDLVDPTAEEQEEVRLLGHQTVDEVIKSAEASLSIIQQQEQEEQDKIDQIAAAKEVDAEVDVDIAVDDIKEHDDLTQEVKEAEKIRLQLEQELAENDGWVKILGNDELMKKVIEAGSPNKNPLRGDICQIKVEGRLIQDELVIFEKTGEAIHIQLGDAEVIPGLDLAIPLMTQGEVASIKISPRFAYGSTGLPPLIPPNAILIYTVELLSSHPEPDLVDLSVKERREIGNRKRVRGNWWYGRGETSLAVNCYRRALDYLDEAEGGIQYPPDGSSSTVNREEVTPELTQLFQDRLTALNNLAMAQLKLQSYEPALLSVEAVLKCQPTNVKALFRKGKILGEKGETERALDALNKAKSLQPDDASITVEIEKLSRRRKGELQNEKRLYKRMFQKDEKTEQDSSKDGGGGGGGRKPSRLRSSMTMGVVLSGAAIAIAGAMAYRYSHRFL